MENITKRIFDFIFSFLGLALLCPFFLIIAILIKLDSGGPVFFRQERVGKNGKIFKIFKFRTMVDNAEKKGISFATPKNDPRITRTGAILRRYKMDELPQLINVFLGEMSLVGPRPEIATMVELYSNDEKKILSVKPGITDYASLEFRNEGDIMEAAKNPYETYVNEIMPKKLKLNMKYVREQTLILDFELIFRTIYKIIADTFK